MTSRLLLAGGGHLHLAVLRTLAKARPPLSGVELVNDGPDLLYSGMLPGWMAGHYQRPELQIALAPLAMRAGVDFIEDRIVGLDAGARRLRLEKGGDRAYDLLSLAIGSEPDFQSLCALGAPLLRVRPAHRFLAQWQDVAARAREAATFHLACVGGGAGGCELAFAARFALPRARITLVAGRNGLLAGHAEGVARRVRHHLQLVDIALVEADATGAPEGLRLDSGICLPVDCAIAATGALAPSWLAASGLALDGRGFVAVDRAWQSLSHPSVFAGGDIAASPMARITRSGLHAVRAGPQVARNLLAALDGRSLRRARDWKPRLYLLATRPGHAIASGDGWSAEGEWVWRLKDWIDRRYIAANRVPAAQ